MLISNLKRIFSKKIFVLLLILLIAITGVISVWKQKQQNFLESHYSVSDGLGVSIHPGLKEEEIKSIAEAGFKWVRIDIFWSSVETKKGIYDFKGTGYDQLNKSLKENNIKPYYILDYGNSLYEQDRSVNTSEGREAFAKFVKATVTRYGNQKGIWEIWNEPNIEKFWSPQPSEINYALLVKKVAPVIKKNDKGSTIVAPALAGINEQSLTWMQNTLDQGILPYIDAVSVHPYQYDNPENVIDQYQELSSLLKNYSKEDVPIISGEWGYSLSNTKNQKSITEMQQAEYIARMNLVNSLEKIPVSIWYDWKNDGGDPNNREHNFGINSYYSTPKLSYLSIQTLSRTLEGYRFSKKIKTQNPNDYILEFSKGNKKKAIVYWTTENSHHTTIPLKDGKAIKISMLGIKQQVELKKKMGLNLLTSPTYLMIE
ncbi:cellulase family glycosylhydrolase [Priestia aryabhattai]|uniref:cellulase family glycosylhydrolase n=1 Tax=Priestia aryabhattai TaxID=412384 RepID=UPI002E1A2FDB|nr:cellulase family glycosylhydrolase [Priestia aryabhattai]MED4006514.1 cellulase family glycosylhydrolase [Priestia aryabhattai]